MAFNPVSLKNLQDGSSRRYKEDKKRRHLSVTDTGWDKTKAIAKEQLKLSVSEMLEKIGRGELIVTKKLQDKN